MIKNGDNVMAFDDEDAFNALDGGYEGFYIGEDSNESGGFNYVVSEDGGYSSYPYVMHMDVYMNIKNSLEGLRLELMEKNKDYILGVEYE